MHKLCLFITRFMDKLYLCLHDSCISYVSLCVPWIDWQNFFAWRLIKTAESETNTHLSSASQLSHFDYFENWFMQFVVKLDIVPGELGTNIILGIEMLRPLTEFRLVPLIFHFKSNSWNLLVIPLVLINFAKSYHVKGNIFLNDTMI